MVVDQGFDGGVYSAFKAVGGGFEMLRIWGCGGWVEVGKQEVAPPEIVQAVVCPTGAFVCP